MNNITKLSLLFLIFALSIARFIYLGSVPGINNDEALYGIKTCVMMHEPFTFIGFNSYTGPIISYLRLPFYYLMGINIFLLRFPIVILNLIAIFYVYKILKETYNNMTGIIGALLLLIMPWSFIYSRFADETQTTLILFAIGGLYYLNTNKNISSRILAALFLGIGVFNHIIFIIVPISYFIYFLIKNKFKFKLDRANLLFLIIFLGFLIVRIGLILKYHFFWTEGSGIYYQISEAVNKNLISKFIFLTPYFLNMLDGSAFFEKTTGRILFYVLPFNSFLFVASFLFLIFRYKYNSEFKDKDKMFVCIFILNYLICAIFLMWFNPKYFLVTLMFATILIAIFIGTSNIRNSIRIFCMSFIIISNCSYIWYDYIYSFKNKGGRVSYFLVGNSIEDSCDFVDTKVLYDYLKAKGIKDIVVPGYAPRFQLMFLDLKEKRLNILARPENISSGKFCFISYKGDNLPEIFDINKNYLVSKQDSSLNNFQIFLLQK
ncbi:MAG: glycosyltransferase family 39 protein [Candidatus Omnitrophica bacterium]|nr:glycosyltransferase family 39 protein [Candidatus Omnitrophota bacterium]